MLKKFIRISCSRCNYLYDRNNPRCPRCNEPNMLSIKAGGGHSLLFIDWYRSLLLILTAYFCSPVIQALTSIAYYSMYSFTSGESDLDNVISAVQADTVFQGINMVVAGIISLVLCVVALGVYRKAVFADIKKGSSWIFGVLLGSASCVIMYLCGLVTNIVSGGAINGNQEALVNMVKSEPILYFLPLVIIGPALEELAFRVGMFGIACKVNKLVAYVFSVFVFAIIHFDFGGDIVTELLSLPTYLIGGLSLTFIYDRFGLAGSFSAHIVNNLIAFIFCVIG